MNQFMLSAHWILINCFPMTFSKTLKALFVCSLEIIKFLLLFYIPFFLKTQKTVKSQQTVCIPMAKQTNPAVQNVAGMHTGVCYGITGHLDQLNLPYTQNHQISIIASKKEILLLSFCNDLSAFAEQLLSLITVLIVFRAMQRKVLSVHLCRSIGKYR